MRDCDIVGCTCQRKMTPEQWGEMIEAMEAYIDSDDYRIAVATDEAQYEADMEALESRVIK